MLRFCTRGFLSKTDFYRAPSRGYKFEVNPIIPGGGLRKLQGNNEEDYFTKQDNKIFQNIKNHIDHPELLNLTNFSSKLMKQNVQTPPKLPTFQHTCALRHKNLLEEIYFFNEHCDNIHNIMKKKNK